MKLLVLMFHRARTGRHGNAPDLLDAHFGYIAHGCANVLPGDPLNPGRLNVCLSFDDGYYDFYSTVYPLLRRHDLRALLAIPPLVIRDRVDVPAMQRTATSSDAAFADPALGGFCTWPELQEMVASGHVAVAAHGYSHTRLDVPGADLVSEVVGPGTVLESRFNQPIRSFVFPYGRYSPAALQLARAHYPYVFRIGGAANRNWNGSPLYRVDADEMAGPTSLFAPSRRLGYSARFTWNRLRGR